jgi:hypothetical protein
MQTTARGQARTTEPGVGRVTCNAAGMAITPEAGSCGHLRIVMRWSIFAHYERTYVSSFLLGRYFGRTQRECVAETSWKRLRTRVT